MIRTLIFDYFMDAEGRTRSKVERAEILNYA